MPAVDPSVEINQTLVQIFHHRTQHYREKIALSYWTAEGYQDISWKEWAKFVELTALGLSVCGIEKGDRVAILSENRPEWTYADLGILALGASVVPIYPTSAYKDVLYILDNAGIKILFVSCREQYDRLSELISDCKTLEKIIIFDSCNVKDSDLVLTLDSLYALGQKKLDEESMSFEALVQAGNPDDIATIIYTSGTTGPPKGVMLSHKNFVANYLSARKVIPVTENDVALSFLPLSHVFERLAGYYFMVFHGARIAYARSMKTVAEDIVVVRPTVAAAVPRFYEKIYGGIQERVQSASEGTKKLFAWAQKVGAKFSACKMEKKTVSLGLWFQHALAKKLVFSKLSSKLGGRIRFFISGGAPLLKELAEFFYAADILILEGYGLTETSPVIAVNSVAEPKFGTVGRPLDVAKVKIAEDGEILTSGDCVMKGYYQNQKKTDEVIVDGWFHTGDIGEIDAEGYLKITDRKKDIIVTSGGKNVAPQNIENLIQTDTLFSQVVIIGDGRNYLVALVALNPEEVKKIAAENGLENLSWKELLQSEDLYKIAEIRMKEKTQELASYEQIKYFAFLEQELCQEADELTPTLKVKRKFVTQKYADKIEALYVKGASYHRA